MAFLPSPHFSPNIFSFWASIRRCSTESVCAKFFRARLFGALHRNSAFAAKNKLILKNLQICVPRVIEPNCLKHISSTGVSTTCGRCLSTWQPHKKNGGDLEGEKENTRELGYGQPRSHSESDDAVRARSKIWKRNGKEKFQKTGTRAPKFLRKNYKDLSLMQEQFQIPHRQEAKQNVRGKVKWYAQHKPKSVDTRELNEDDDESDSEDEQYNSRETQFYKRLKSPATDPNKTRNRSHKENLQKTGAKGPRPSRYHFSDVSSEEEQLRWLRRPEAQQKPRSKAEWYARHMLRLVNESEVDMALEMFERMRSDRIRPTVEIFNILISALARTQRIRRAFNFYNDMKKQGLKATPHTYSSLFNACAESPFPEHALDRAEKLWNEMSSRVSDDELKLSVITCNAAVKAFAICGNPATSFSIYDMILQEGASPDTHTYAMLLTACGYDAKEGPKKAVCVLDEMKAHGVKPDIFIFNHVLKAIRDSLALRKKSGRRQKSLEVPSENNSKDFREDHLGKRITADFAIPNTYEEKYSSIPELTENNSSHAKRKENSSFSGSNSKTETDCVVSGDSAEHKRQNNDTTFGLKTRSVSESEKEATLNISEHGSDQFLGTESFLQRMAMDEVTPDIRTFHLLLQLAKPGNAKDEEFQLEMMKSFGVPPDEVFMNTLIRRRAVNNTFSQAKLEELCVSFKPSFYSDPKPNHPRRLKRTQTFLEKGLLKVMQAEFPGLKANEKSYQSLAVGCRRREDGLWLLDEMKEQGFSPSTSIYGSLIWTATGRHNYQYLTELLKRMSKDCMEPNQRILTLLQEAAAAKARQAAENVPLAVRKQQDRMYLEQQGFRGYYKLWKRKWVPDSTRQDVEEQGSDDKFDADDDEIAKYSHL